MSAAILLGIALSHLLVLPTGSLLLAVLALLGLAAALVTSIPLLDRLSPPQDLPVRAAAGPRPAHQLHAG